MGEKRGRRRKKDEDGGGTRPLFPIIAIVKHTTFV